MKLCRISFSQMQQIVDGRLVYLTHPKKGDCKVYSNYVYVRYEELTDKEKSNIGVFHLDRET